MQTSRRNIQTPNYVLASLLVYQEYLGTPFSEPTLTFRIYEVLDLLVLLYRLPWLCPNLLYTSY